MNITYKYNNNVVYSCKYFAVLNMDFEPQPMSNQGGSIGIDVGIKKVLL